MQSLTVPSAAPSLTSLLSASHVSVSMTCMWRIRCAAALAPLARWCSCSSSAIAAGSGTSRGTCTRCTQIKGVEPSSASFANARDNRSLPRTSSGCSGPTVQQHSARSSRRCVSGMLHAPASASASCRQLEVPGGSRRDARRPRPAARCSSVSKLPKRRPEGSVNGTAWQVLARSPHAFSAAATPSASAARNSVLGGGTTIGSVSPAGTTAGVAAWPQWQQGSKGSTTAHPSGLAARWGAAARAPNPGTPSSRFGHIASAGRVAAPFQTDAGERGGGGGRRLQPLHLSVCSLPGSVPAHTPQSTNPGAPASTPQRHSRQT